MPSASFARAAEIPSLASLRYTARFTESYLDGLRSKGDPISDRVVAELAAANELRNVHDLLGEVRRRADAGSATCKEFLDEVSSVPSWASFERMTRGQRMIAAFPVHMGLSLFAGSLCGGAVFQKMAIVTSMTGMFGGASNRRVNETGALVLRMALPGALEPGGEGHELLVRVRLLHSAIRRFLVDSGRFRHPTEVAINQQDLAITLALFGFLNIRSLARFGVRFSDDELDSYNHLWRYAGHVIGIEEDLLPNGVDDQREFFYASMHHQGRPEKLSPKTKDVLDDVARGATKPVPMLYAVTRDVLHQTCRYLSGNEYVSGMELEDAGDRFWALVLLRATGTASSFAWRTLPGADSVLYAVGATGYRLWLEHAKKHADAKGGYRVRTAERAREGAAVAS